MSNVIDTQKINLLIGQLEVMIAAAEPGMVLTENMTLFCHKTLNDTVVALRGGNAIKSTLRERISAVAS